MNVWKIAREWKRAGFALVLAGAVICVISGCDALNAIGELNYLGKWAGSLFGSGTSTSF